MDKLFRLLFSEARLVSEGRSPLPGPRGPHPDGNPQRAPFKSTGRGWGIRWVPENARRRADEEISKARKFAVESFAESLLPVADSLEAGLQLKDASTQQIREGTEATLKQLKSALERNRVMEIAPDAGTKFDPHQHQAISMVPLPAESTQEANTVVNVLQKGYLIADRVLRPALVTVAAPK